MWRKLSILVCLMIQLGTLRAFGLSSEYCLPHIANGSFDAGSFRTTFLFLNNGSDNATVHLRLTGDDGKPLTLTIPGLGTGSEFTIDLPVGATRFLQTDGSGELVTGAARTDFPGVSAIFSIYDKSGAFVTEAGVGDSPPDSRSVIPVDVTGPFNTGVALFNPSATEAIVSFFLMDTNGKEVAHTDLTLPPGGHLSRFVPATTNSSRLSHRSAER